MSTALSSALNTRKELEKLVPTYGPLRTAFLQELWSRVFDMEDTVMDGDWLEEVYRA